MLRGDSVAEPANQFTKSTNKFNEITMIIEQIPTEVLEKAEIVGNIFDEIKTLKKALDTICRVASIHNEDETNPVLNNIYKIAHAYSGHCTNPHDDWRALGQEMELKLKDY